jgi:hypothetical protein
MTPTSLPRAGSATQRLRTAARQPSELRRARNPRFDGHAAEADPQNDGPGDGPDRELGIRGPWIVCHAAACAAGENDRREVIGVEEAGLLRSSSRICTWVSTLAGSIVTTTEQPRVILDDRELAVEDVQRPSTRPTTRCRTRNIAKVCIGSTS